MGIFRFNVKRDLVLSLDNTRDLKPPHGMCGRLSAPECAGILPHRNARIDSSLFDFSAKYFVNSVDNVPGLMRTLKDLWEGPKAGGYTGQALFNGWPRKKPKPMSSVSSNSFEREFLKPPGLYLASTGFFPGVSEGSGFGD
jgi:hypothetical protein